MRQTPEMEQSAMTKLSENPIVFRGIIVALCLLAALGLFLAFRPKNSAEPARKRFLPQSVLQKVSESAETNSSGDDVDKLNRALGDRMQKLSAKLSAMQQA